MKRIALWIAVVVFVFMANTPGAGGPAALSQAEVGERQSDSLAGRSTRTPDAASDLFLGATARVRPGAATDDEVTSRASTAPSTEPQALFIDPDLGLSAENSSVRVVSVSERGDEALLLISYPWVERLGGWTIRFEDEQAGFRGLTFSGERLIEVYVRPSDTTWDLARVVAHEIGHAVDLELNTTTDRLEWRSQRGIEDDAPWWPTAGTVDFSTGAGDFAECFAAWQVGSSSLSKVGGECTGDDVALLEELSDS